ncbi:MAG TPA: hypothetical protein VNN22_22925 [Verrucomicrobiae bacterium]|nr:hypothetical protein [Verrucomicrobiae bacterium]
MSKIRIGDSEKSLDEASESWIVNQVNGRAHDGQAVCVQIVLKDDGVDMILSTPQCGGGGGGGRPPNHKELEILELWNHRHLNQQKWEVGNLIAFLKQLRRLV